MKNKLLVIGSGGLIGHQVLNFLKESKNYEIFDISKSRKIHKNTILLDARDEKNFFEKISEINPNYIIRPPTYQKLRRLEPVLFELLALASVGRLRQ